MVVLCSDGNELSNQAATSSEKKWKSVVYRGGEWRIFFRGGGGITWFSEEEGGISRNWQALRGDQKKKMRISGGGGIAVNNINRDLIDRLLWTKICYFYVWLPLLFRHDLIKNNH